MPETITTPEEFVKWLKAPDDLFNFVHKKSIEPKGVNPETKVWLDRWNQILAGAPLPELEWMNVPAPQPQEAIVPVVPQKHIDDGERILNALMNTNDELEAAIENQMVSHEAFSEIEHDVEMAESEATIMDKNGHLEGLAKTSKEYKAALTIVLNEARKEDFPELYNQYKQMKETKMRAEMELEKLRTRWMSLRHGSDLKGDILRAFGASSR